MQKGFEVLDYLLPYLIPTGIFGFLLTKKVTCKCINTVLQIQGNSFIRVDTYEISKPTLAIIADKINLPVNIKPPTISYPNTDTRDIIKIKKNILKPKIWSIEGNSKITVRIQYEWFPEKNELYITNQDTPQIHPHEIIINYKVTNVSDYDLQCLELSVNLPYGDIDPNRFNPKFLEIIDLSKNQKIQRRAGKLSLLNDDLVHALEIIWEVEIEAKKTKIFEIHYILNNV
ncbi:MAG: hypothetical protein WA130_17530 [Candidatus Methanoperedens sp.]